MDIRLIPFIGAEKMKVDQMRGPTMTMVADCNTLMFICT